VEALPPEDSPPTQAAELIFIVLVLHCIFDRLSPPSSVPKNLYDRQFARIPVGLRLIVTARDYRINASQCKVRAHEERDVMMKTTAI
jgi:hypothetical protein